MDKDISKHHNPIEYIKKYSRSRDKELKYDFMPKILEIIERPAHMAGTVIILGIMTLLIVAVTWACLSKVDVVINAAGTVQPAGNLNVVQSYVGGTVESINVSEGMYVEAGDILVELDTRSVDIDVEQLGNEKVILQAQRDIYTRILNGDDVSRTNIQAYDDELQSYVQAIIDTDANYHNNMSNLDLEKENAQLNYDISKLQLNEYKNTGNRNQIDMQELVVEQQEVALEKIELSINDTKTQYNAQVNAKISEIDAQIAEINTNLEKYELSITHQNLTAPVSGYVNSIEVNTVGETVSTGQDIITIVPDDAPLEVVCYVKNMDIADIKLGMTAEIKLEAYPYNKYGTLKGEVKYISPSAFVSEEMGSVYLVKLEIVNKHEDINLVSGLSGSVEIKIGKRTIMDYFMEPIMKGFDESLKEK